MTERGHSRDSSCHSRESGNPDTLCHSHENGNPEYKIKYGSPINTFGDDSEGHSRESGNPGEKIIWTPNQVGDDKRQTILDPR